MKTILKNALLNNLTLKAISLVIGYSFWHACSNTQTIHLQYKVPICFYNSSEHQQFSAPEHVSVTLQSTRTQLHALIVENLAVHIDAARLHTGPNALEISPDTLLLPASIKLVHYTPTNVIVTVNTV